jgi:cytochrome b561
MRNIERYTRAAIGLHWLIAALLVLNTALALSADHWPDEWVRPVIDAHKSIGITALGLALLRILWRTTHSPPPLPAAYASWERRASHLAHGVLYILIFALPLSGWLHDSAWRAAPTHPMRLFGLTPWPRIGFIENQPPEFKERLHDIFFAFHVAFAYALYAMLALHILGALKHQWIDRQAELQRMWPASRPRN